MNLEVGLEDFMVSSLLFLQSSSPHIRSYIIVQLYLKDLGKLVLLICSVAEP